MNFGSRDLIDPRARFVRQTGISDLNRNGRLKRLVVELSLEKQILKNVAEGNF